MRLGRPNAKEPSWMHGQPVDLPDLAAFRVDQHDAAGDRLLRAVAQPVGALDLLVDGARHVLLGGDLALGLARPVVGLAHDVGDAADLDRQLLAVVRQPRALVDEAGDAGRVERLEPVLLDDRGDQPGVGVVVLGGAGDGVVEIGLHLEEARQSRDRGPPACSRARGRRTAPRARRAGSARDRAICVETRLKPAASAGCSMRISRALMARFRASQANGESSTLRASSSR